MHKISSEYLYRVTLPVKINGNKRFSGNYKPLNAQMWWNSFPMPLIDDVGLIGKIGMIYRFGTLIWVLANFDVT